MMGSLDLEEERLLQMVNDFIESESSTKTNTTCSFPSSSSSSAVQNHARFGHSAHYFTVQEILGNKTEEERRISETVRKHMRNQMGVEKTTEVKKWLVNLLKMDGLHASLCHTSWVTTPGCPCGNYEYIEVLEEDVKGNSNRLIVDVDFKSQFEVARPTKRYTELSSKLPPIFVGREDKLKTIISLLCSAAEESLKERGLHIPPWRRPSYVHSKYWKFSNNNCPNCHNKSPKSQKNPKNDTFGKWVAPAHVMIKGW